MSAHTYKAVRWEGETFLVERDGKPFGASCATRDEALRDCDRYALEDVERPKFEEWAGPRGHELHRNAFDDALYAIASTEEAWGVWMARAALDRRAA